MHRKERTKHKTSHNWRGDLSANKSLLFPILLSYLPHHSVDSLRRDAGSRITGDSRHTDPTIASCSCRRLTRSTKQMRRLWRGHGATRQGSLWWAMACGCVGWRRGVWLPKDDSLLPRMPGFPIPDTIIMFRRGNASCVTFSNHLDAPRVCRLELGGTESCTCAWLAAPA